MLTLLIILIAISLSTTFLNLTVYRYCCVRGWQEPSLFIIFGAIIPPVNLCWLIVDILCIISNSGVNTKKLANKILFIKKD